jgi:hypothetical protein
MGSRWTRIVVPVIGLLAVTTALALIGIAPLVLFPGSQGKGALPAAPHASREVAHVTAPPLQPPTRKGGAAPTQSAGSTSGGTTSGGTTSAAPQTGALVALSPSVGGVAVGEAEKPGRTVTSRLGEGDGQPDSEGREEPSEKVHGKGHGKAKGHDKPKHHGKAKGHDKPKPNGKAKGHAKHAATGAVASAHAHGAKSGHVAHPRVGKHSGRSTRAHARARC